MIRFLTIDELLEIHAEALRTTGGGEGIKNFGMLESSIAQPQMTYDGQELYPALADKAAILSFSINSNHSFTDGNKRVSYIAMRLFLQLNGHDLSGIHEEKERVILAVAASEMSQEEFFDWVRAHVVPLTPQDEKP